MSQNHRGKGHGRQGAKSPSAVALRSASPKIAIVSKPQVHHTVRVGKDLVSNARKSPMPAHESESRRKGTPSQDQQPAQPQLQPQPAPLLLLPLQSHDLKVDATAGSVSTSAFAHRDDFEVGGTREFDGKSSQQSLEAYFLDLERKDLTDSEVEQCFLETRLHDDDARKRLEVLVNKQRQIATSVTHDGQPGSSGSSRFSPSLSSSQELLRKIPPANHTKLLPTAQKGAKLPASTVPLRQSPSNTSGSSHVSTSKSIGGFYIVKGGLAMGLVAPVAVKENAFSAADEVETGSAASDDNDSASTTGIVRTQFASIIHDNDLGLGHANTTYARKQSDDMQSEGSETSAAGSNISDRTQAEPYLTSLHGTSSGLNTAKHVAATGGSVLSTNRGGGGFSRVGVGGIADDDIARQVYTDSVEKAPAGVELSVAGAPTAAVSSAHTSSSKGAAGRPRVDCLDTIVSNISQVTAVIKTRKDGGDNGGNYDYTSSEAAISAPDTESACADILDDEPQFVSLDDDFTLLSDEALLSLSELRQKIDEVDRIRSRREMSRKIEQMQVGAVVHAGASIKPVVRAASAPLVAPAALPVGRKTAAGVNTKKTTSGGHYSRSAWEEPPVGRQHGSQLKNDKMFQSVLDDAATGDSSVSMFSTSPGSNRTLTNFGSRPNSRGTSAADNVNASIKQAITQIIRTNVQRGEPVSITGVPLVPGVRGSGSVTRNTLRNTHIAPQSSILDLALSGVTSLDISLAEARRLSSPLQVSPRTAFDDRSVSSTDSYRSHSSHYSSASGVSLSAREDRHHAMARPLPVSTKMPQPQPSRKSALSIAMNEASVQPMSVTHVAHAAKVALLSDVAVSTLPPTVVPSSVEFSSLESRATCDKDDLDLPVSVQKSGNQGCFEQSRERLPSLPIAIAQPSVLIADTSERRQSGSAPAHISVELLDRSLQSKGNEKSGAGDKEKWLDEDEEELSGIFR